MTLEKQIKNDVKLIIRRTFTHLAYADIKKNHSLFFNLGLAEDAVEILKYPFENHFGVSIKKKELRACYDVDDIIELVHDKIIEMHRQREMAAAAAVIEPSVELLISMAAKLAKADGVVGQEEINLMNLIFNHLSKNEDSIRTALIAIWNRVKADTNTFEYYVDRFHAADPTNSELFDRTLGFLFDLAAADKRLHAREESMLRYAAHKFGKVALFEKLKEEHFPNTDKYYEILNCKKDYSVDKIKSNYRKLALEFHPDKFVSKNLPGEMLQFAEKRFKEVQEAYEIIMKKLNVPV